MKAAALLALLLPAAAAASDCSARRERAYRELAERWRLPHMRRIVKDVLRVTRLDEQELFFEWSRRFNSLPHEGAGAEERYALQKRARSLTRELTVRAGYRVSNPEEGSPYDALVAEIMAEDGQPDYLVELRSLLVLSDPRPHATIWPARMSSSHNPWRVVTYGLMDEALDDYVSWRPEPGGPRVSAPAGRFLDSLLPEDCRRAEEP